MEIGLAEEAKKTMWYKNGTKRGQNDHVKGQTDFHNARNPLFGHWVLANQTQKLVLTTVHTWQATHNKNTATTHGNHKIMDMLFVGIPPNPQGYSSFRMVQLTPQAADFSSLFECGPPGALAARPSICTSFVRYCIDDSSTAAGAHDKNQGISLWLCFIL